MKKKGFTLIELLVTITISGILLAVGITAYNEFNKRQTLKVVTLNLKNDLQAAKNKALAGEKDCTAGVCGGTISGCSNDSSEKTLDGWYVSFSANSYTIYGRCSGVNFSSTTFSLPTSITISTLPSPNPIFFKVLGQGTNVNGSTNIILSYSGLALTQTITVSSTGEIK